MAEQSVVAKLFEESIPQTVSYLGNPDSYFWSRVDNNTIPNSELVANIHLYYELGKFDSKVFAAAIELLYLRSEGRLPTPAKTRTDISVPQ